jgi:hypothetical protein
MARCVDRIHTAEGGDKWRADETTVMNIRGISWLTAKMLASHKGLCSMEVTVKFYCFLYVLCWPEDGPVLAETCRLDVNIIGFNTLLS